MKPGSPYDGKYEQEPQKGEERKCIMDKINNMQKNKVADDELEQVGGGKFFDVFTTEFREFFDRADSQNNPMAAEEDEPRYGVSTLEMRAEPKKKTKINNTDVIKL